MTEHQKLQNKIIANAPRGVGAVREYRIPRALRCCPALNLEMQIACLYYWEQYETRVSFNAKKTKLIVASVNRKISN